MTERTLIDATAALSAQTCVWPGDPRISLARVSSIEDGKPCNVTKASFTVHAGTHVDAPCHFIRDGSGVDTLPLQVLIGPAYVLDLGDHHGPVTTSELSGVPSCERLILRTGNTRRGLMRRSDFEPEYSHLAEDAALWLADHEVKLIGIDYLSVEAFEAPSHAVHQILLGKGIVAVEGLDLADVSGGWWDMICLPLKLKDSDGSPARVVFQRRD